MTHHTLRKRIAPFISFGILLLFILLGRNVHPLFYLGVLSIFPMISVISRAAHRLREKELLEELAGRWGQDAEREDDLQKLKHAYGVYRNQETDDDLLDDQTWRDLDMDAIFARIDQTLTLPGEIGLYEILKNPCVQQDTLNKRSALIHLFEENEEIRQAMQLELALTGKADPLSMVSFLWNDVPQNLKVRHALPPLAAMALLAALSPLFFEISIAFLLVALMMCVNFCVAYFVVRRHVYLQIQAMRYVGAIIRRAQRMVVQINNLDGETAQPFPDAPTTISRAVRKLPNIIQSLSPERAIDSDVFQLFSEYISGYLLLEARAYCKVLRIVEAHVDEIRSLYDFVAEIDALLAVASFRASLPQFCEPNFNDELKPLCIENAHHMLLSEAIPNSIKINAKSPFVTGANMSGKTTFLRTIALNAVLAQSIYTCCASRYEGGLYKIVTSIVIKDDIGSGKSHYYAELERMRSIVQSADAGEPLLCVIDELLRGTNAHERRAASAALLNSLSKPSVITLVSSHDTDLGLSLADAYENLHFESTVTENGLEFDYVVRTGQATSGNAIALMTEMDFPENIVSQAKALLNRTNTDDRNS
jgi:DNA mismatch repair ATPase MutS